MWFQLIRRCSSLATAKDVGAIDLFSVIEIPNEIAGDLLGTFDDVIGEIGLVPYSGESDSYGLRSSFHASGSPVAASRIVSGGRE